MKRFDVLMPTRSQYGVLHHFTQKLYEALKRQNLTCRLIDNESIDTEILKNPPDFTIGFNGAPQHSSGILFADLIEKPHVCCLMDLSYRYLFLLESPYILMTCNDQLSCELLRLKKNTSNPLFLPPGVEKEMDFDPAAPRDLDIVLMATFIDFEERRKIWKEQFPASVYEMMHNTIEIVFSTSKIQFMEAFQLVFNEYIKNGKFGGSDKFDFITVWEELELYLRGRERVDLVKSIKEIPIHIFDSSIDKTNWRGYFQDKHSNLIFHPPISFKESFNILKRSKFVLNSSPHTRNGAHERVFNALACGAVPITEENLYLPTQFEHGTDLIFFSHPNLKQIEENVLSFMDEGKRQALVRSGREKVMANHTWDHRVETLLDFLQKVESSVNLF